MHNWEHYSRLPAYFLMATLVASCGGGSDILSLNGQSSAAIVDAPAKVLAAVDGSTSFSVRLTDGGKPIAGTVVAAAVSSGTAKLSKASATTDATGVATFSLSGNGAVDKGTVTITYTDSKGDIATQTVAYEVLDGTGVASNYKLTNDSSASINIPTSGNTTATVSITLKDPDGKPVKDALLEFTLASNVAGVGRINISSAKTNDKGQATVTIDGLNQNAGDNQLRVSYKDSFKSDAILLVPFKVVNQFDVLLTAPTDKLKTGNDSVVLTATVVNASQSLVKDAKVSFQILSNEPKDGAPLIADPCPSDVTNTQQFKSSALTTATKGTLSRNNILTDENGQATTTFTIADNKNGNRRILVTVDNQALVNKPVACIDLKLAGTVLTLEPDSAINTSVGKAFPITATIKNARGLSVKNARVDFVVTEGSATPAPPSATDATVTDASGAITRSFTASANAKINAKSDDLGVDASVKAIDVLISDLGVNIDFLDDKNNSIDNFPITTVFIGDVPQQTVPLLVKVKDTNGHVTLGTTLGSLGQQELTLANGEATTFIYSTQPGTARVDVRVVKEDGKVVTGSKLFRFISTIPKKMTLQSSLSTLNSGEQAEILAEVLDAKDSPVEGAVVHFTSEDPSNGRLSSSLVTTDANGKASVVFTAGTKSTAKDGVVLTSYINNNDGVRIVNAAPVKLTVGGQPLFISIATGKTIQVVNETVYALPMSVVVVDAAGHPVRDQSVSLDVIPTNYLKGIYYFDTVAKVWQTVAINPSVFVSSSDGAQGVGNPISCPNEDDNGNGILDIGEDENTDGVLWPGNPVTVLKNVTTDDTGRASFNILYGKSYANWLDVQLTASVKVSGSESKTARDFFLPVLSADVTDATISPPGGTVSPFGQTTYTLPVRDANGRVITGTVVTPAPAACKLKRNQGGVAQ